MKLVFFGTPQFAVPTLERLVASKKHEILAVVTQPDKPAGRGQKVSAPAVKVVAQQHGIPVLQPASVRTDEFAQQLVALAPDVAVVVAYGKILPKRILDTPRHGCLNIHGSLLPKYRGAAPIQWALIRGERKSGITIMQMDEGMDTGPMIATSEVEILEDDDAVSLANMLSFSGAALMEEILDKLQADGRLDSTPQDHAEATMAPLIKREMARIDWSLSPEQVILAIRGFQPWPVAFTTNKDKDLKVLGAEAVHPDWIPPTTFDDRVKPGTVVELFKSRGFVVKTGGKKGAILLTRVQPAGKSEMGALDYFNGGGVAIGTVLGA